MRGRFGRQGNIQSLSCQEFEDEEENVVLQKRMRRMVKLGIGGIKGGVMGVGPALEVTFRGGSPQGD